VTAMSEPKTLATFDAGYSSTGEISVANGTCDVCKTPAVPVIEIDCSEHEYESGRICKDCALRAFQEV
jgi:hypothetical protein